MNYSKQLTLLSGYIQQLQSNSKDEVFEIIDPHKLSELNIYQKNLFGLIYSQIGDYYPVTQKYLGVNNFKFLIRQFIISGSHNSLTLDIVSANFVGFLEKMHTTHQDDLVVDIAKVDWLWSNCVEKKILTAKGILSYWLALSESKETDQIIIDFNLNENISLKIKNDEKYLILEKDNV